MKQTMKNWIDLAKEVLSSTQGEGCNKLDSKTCLVFMDGIVSFQYGSLDRVEVAFYLRELIKDRVCVSFSDDLNNPIDFDALYEEARQWWEQFKTSGHEILIDTQIKNKLNNDTSGQL